jgi:hypothetical protein
MNQSDQVSKTVISNRKKQENKILDEWSKLIEWEKVKYKSGGLGIIVGSALLFIYFTILPNLIGTVYKNYMDKSIDINKGKFTFWTIFITHHSTFIIINIILYLIYVGKYSFFERYRISSDPWPWEENPSDWKKLLEST